MGGLASSYDMVGRGLLYAASSATTDGDNPDEQAIPSPNIAAAGDCPAGYGTIYKYDGTTECIAATTPNIAQVIREKTAGSVADQILQAVAPTSTDPNACGWDLSCQLNKLLATAAPWAIGVGVVVGLVAVAYVVRAFR